MTPPDRSADSASARSHPAESKRSKEVSVMPGATGLTFLAVSSVRPAGALSSSVESDL
ncbi:hypothetical protein [Nonomuraea dietziae]|uniref:Uncharacterized protein n=1 Tax=Nonomuraea dietziae TaxID=65515 RepID=A0A7W5V4R2_9ACTN|nr:hypothetical protein [Nonomuraea dietziae]MBB3725524.1 hypothetical protein [Nonomuraea dietziae]